MNSANQNFLLQLLSLTTLFLISFFFIFWIGSFFEIDIFPLENRSTIHTTFQIYIFDKNVDSIIITILTIFWLCLSLRGKERIVSAISYGSLTAIAFFTNFGPLQDASVIISLPIIASLFIYQQFSTKKIIQIQTTMLMNFFSVAVLCIVSAGVMVTILTFSLSSGTQVWLRNYSIDIFLLFSSFSPVLIFFSSRRFCHQIIYN